MNDHTFWVVLNKETGLFFRKYKYLTYRQQRMGATRADHWTDKLGRARIFESEAVAKRSVPIEWLNADMLEFVQFVGIPYKDTVSKSVMRRISSQIGV